MISPYRKPGGVPKPLPIRVYDEGIRVVHCRDAFRMYEDILKAVTFYGGPVLTADEPRMLRIWYVMDHARLHWWIGVRDLRTTIPEHLKPYMLTRSGRVRIAAALSCGSDRPD